MTTLTTNFERVELPLADPFSISRGTTDVAENIIVEIDDGDHVGIGGAAPSERYDETVQSAASVLPKLFEILQEVGDLHALDWIANRLQHQAPDEAAARAAVSVALHDLIAKRLDLPLYSYFGLDPETTPPTSYTIGIGEPAAMAQTARVAVEAGFPILKVKVDNDRPIEQVAAVRDVAPNATIRIDANEAWGPERAVSVSRELRTQDVSFVEQPVSTDDSEDLEWLGARTSLPLAADESCLVASDVPEVAPWADIVVIKLMKCGGLRDARRMKHAAHAYDLEVMLGCMVESNASIAAACHLAPAVEYADLDGSLLLADDPFEGVTICAGDIDLDAVDRPGTTARRR